MESRKEEKPVKIVQNYDLFEILGEGAFGKVYRGVNRKTEEQVAVKQISKKILQTNNLIKYVENEVKILKTTYHQNIVRLLDLIVTGNNYYLIFELCDKEDFRKYLKKKGKLQPGEALHYLKQIASGMKHLQEKKIHHRDLKPENLLMKDGVIKISDFGLSIVSQEGNHATTCLGTLCYVAPEIISISQSNSKDSSYDCMADMWSLGIILFEMLFGEFPWGELDNQRKFWEFHKKIAERNKIECLERAELPNKCKELLIGMLNVNPKDRLTWDELYNHRAFKLSTENQYKHDLNLVSFDLIALGQLDKVLQIYKKRPDWEYVVKSAEKALVLIALKSKLMLKKLKSSIESKENIYDLDKRTFLQFLGSPQAKEVQLKAIKGLSAKLFEDLQTKLEAYWSEDKKFLKSLEESECNSFWQIDQVEKMIIEQVRTTFAGIESVDLESEDLNSKLGLLYICANQGKLMPYLDEKAVPFDWMTFDKTVGQTHYQMNYFKEGMKACLKELPQIKLGDDEFSVV